MFGRASNFLGLAFSDRGIACAEISSSGDRRTVRRTATFPFSADVSLDKPEAAGQALAAFLREKRFGTSRVVAGVPAKWLIAAEKELPPANEQQARAALQLHAERIGEGAEIVFDYAGKPHPQAATRVLLVGIARSQLTKVETLLDAAGLSVEAITSTGLAIANSVKRDAEADMLMLGASGAEMILRQSGAARLLRHISVTPNGHGTPAIGPLGAEIRRAVMLATSNGAPKSEMFLLDGLGLAADQVSELSTRAGVPMRAGDELKLLGLSPESAALARAQGEDSQPIGHFAPAVSLALAGVRSDALPLDFARSRLAPAPVKRLGRMAWIGIAVAALLLVYIGMTYMEVRDRQRTLEEIRAQYEQRSGDALDAKTLIDRVNIARGYFEQRPRALECLRELTAAFRDDEKIWITNFTIRNSPSDALGKGTLNGKAADQETILMVVDRLKKNPKFTAVSGLDMPGADARTREWSFSLSFTFNFAE